TSRIEVSSATVSSWRARSASSRTRVGSPKRWSRSVVAAREGIYPLILITGSLLTGPLRDVNPAPTAGDARPAGPHGLGARLPDAEQLPQPHRPRGHDADFGTQLPHLAQRIERAGAVHGVARVGLPDDLPGDAVCAHDLRRGSHHQLRHDGQNEGGTEREREAPQRPEPVRVLLQVVPREAQVTRLLGDVDLHDAPEQGVELLALAQRHALHVIDRILAAEHEHEEELRERAAEAHHLASAEALPPDQPGNIEPGPVHELLEHEGVLRLLDDLV